MFACVCERVTERAMSADRNKAVMESSISADEEKMIKVPLLSDGSTKGGLRTMPFILANETFEKVAGNALTPNMIMYLMGEYHLEMASGTNILFLWGATSNFMAILGAVIADSFVGRFRMVGFGSIFSLVGMVLFWLTTMIPQARPPPCNESTSICISATTFQLFLLCSCFGLMSIGAGGIRSSSLAFGADQFKKGDGQIDARALEMYFNWYYASFTLSIFIALTVFVYLQDNMGWQVGFGIPALLMFLSALSFFLASHMYVKFKARSSLIVGMIQVAVASYRKRHAKLSPESSNMLYHHKEGSDLIRPSESHMFLNKACMVLDPEQDLTKDGTPDPWSLCTVDQVEELKVLLKVIPIWTTGMLATVTINQGSFLVLQAKSMNRKIGTSFEVPAGSFGIIGLVSVVLWVALYHQIILPIASKLIGKPAHLTAKQRMGIGILLCFLSMILTAIVETIRRFHAIKEGYSDDPDAVVDMSSMWLIPQYILIGLGEGINVIAQIEFYNSEFPTSMSSIASTLGLLGSSVASLVASFIMNTVDYITRRGGQQSWISSNINKGHYDYYCFLLAGLTVLDMIYYIVCCKAYGPCKADKQKILDQKDDSNE